MTRKQWLYRVLPMTVSLIAILLLAFSCSVSNANNAVPEVNDKDKDFVTLGDLSVSNQEVYESLIDNFGAKQISRDIARDLLTNGTVDYVALAKADAEFDIEERLEKSIYGTTYAKAELLYTDKALTDMLTQFEENIQYNGYADLNAYKEDIYLEHARDLFTRDYIVQNSEVTLNDVKSYYEEKYYDSACAIVVRFNTLEEGYAALSEQGLTVASTGYFAEDVTKDQILEAYVNIYNNVNQDKTPITYENGFVPECGGSELSYSFEDLSASNPDLADFLFISLNTNYALDTETVTEMKPYSTPVAIQANGYTGYYVVFKLLGDNANSFRSFFDTLTDDEYQALFESDIAEVLTGNSDLTKVYELTAKSMSENTTVISDTFKALYMSHEVTIFDPYLKQKFDASFGETVENDGSKAIAYSYLNQNGAVVEVTVDQLFEAMSNKAATVAINLLNTEVALNDTAAFEMAVTDTAKAEAEAQMQTYKSNFMSGVYESYGFTQETVSWIEFMYQAFGVRSEQDLYNSLLSSQILQAYQANLYVSDDNQEKYYDLMVEYYDNSFSIDLLHFLVYVDGNNNGTPDLPEKTYSETQKELAVKLVGLLNEELSALAATSEVSIASLNAIVEAYNSASYDSDETSETYSKWAEFKQQGLRVKAEDLSTVTQGKMVENFEAEARLMFDKMVDEDLFYLASNNTVETEFGYHMVFATGYTERGDAYPEDDSLVFPSRNEITEFNAQNFENVDSQVIVFIGNYYTPAQDEYLSAYRLVMFDDARASYGTPIFHTFELTNIYNNLVEINKTQAER